jgi:beta-aspartyl-peptidase (threonine type)
VSDASWIHVARGWAVLVHGGAGPTPIESSAKSDGCRAAVERAAQMLSNGCTALDAVEKAVCVLEDDERYNAGTGASLNEHGEIELDAAIMAGADLRYGAVCALPPFANPVAVARAVLEEGSHVLYAGEGARSFAVRAGFSPVVPEELITDRARQQLAGQKLRSDASHGTVGAVAIDLNGSLAAATSTGGLTGKRRGRIGDSPIAGAGTYADDRAGAVSATGQGEGILRVHLAGRIAFELGRGTDPESAARAGLATLRDRTAALGGVIVIDRLGRMAWAHTTRSMPWAAACSDAAFEGNG